MNIHDLVHQIKERPTELLVGSWSVPQGPTSFIKARLKPVLLKNELFFQIETFTEKQSFTKNIALDALLDLFLEYSKEFSELFLRFTDKELYVHFSTGAIRVKTKSITAEKASLTHNRTKKHVFTDGEPVDFLIALGIQKPDGRVIREKYDKFKQIVHFIELMSPVFVQFEENCPLVLADLACGKAYLTFALYHYLTQKGHSVQLYGVDVKADVIAKCQDLKTRLGYDGMHFMQKSIAEFSLDRVDIVVSLHACDTATDLALAKAIQMQARAIIAAPCCQHEVAAQLKKQPLELIMGYGLLKERFASILTDALRAELLEQFGYETAVVEFVDPEHTPKNLILRACKKVNPTKPDFTKFHAVTKEFGITTTLENLLKVT